ncbi:MAG: hypothetical protein LRY36_01500 [Alphaproteobacteria bacterium]|nr:hypothetical protein [Alphaproteobacteria bacterium]
MFLRKINILLEEALKGPELENIRAQLQRIRDEMKSEQGFLKTVFSVWSKETPTEEIVKNAEAFQDFCRRNNISYNIGKGELEKVKTLTDHLRNNRLLLAAIAGTLTGLAGASPENVEILNKAPSLFFAALPMMAVPFISMNVFKAFSNRNLLKEAGTFARFVGLMGIGVGMCFAVTGAMGGHLGALDLSHVYHEAPTEELRTAYQMIQDAYHNYTSGHISAGMGDTATLLKTHGIGNYLLQALAGSIALTGVYKLAKNKGLQAQNKLTRLFSRAGVAAGDAVNKFTDYFDKAFMGFINVAGRRPYSLCWP